MTDASMVERVARAICIEEGQDCDFDYNGRPNWECFIPSARAAIATMRDPTEDMMGAGCEQHSEASDDYVVRDVWKAMIARALITE